MATTIRHYVTSIVSWPAANSQAVTVTKELVPHKYHMVTAGEVDTPEKVAEAFHTVQRNVDDATKSARSLPHLGGAYIPDVQFTAAFTPVVVQTRLQAQVSWSVNGVRPTNGYLPISSVQALSGRIQVTTKKIHSLAAGDTVVINGVKGVSCNQAWQVLAAQDDLNFTLAGSTFAGAYVSGGAVYCPGWDVFECAQDVANGRLTLASTVPMTCDLHLWPKPAAVRS